MNVLTLLVLLTVSNAPAIEVVTLSERQLQGTLESLSTDTVVIKTDSESISIPISDVLVIRQTSPIAASPNETKQIVRMVDGSTLGVQSFVSSGTSMGIVHPQLGELTLPAAGVSSVRFAPPDPKIDGEWVQLLDRAIKKDMVAIRKGDVLDHLDGVIGTLNPTTLQFQLDGENIPVKREKVFGLIYSKRESSSKKSVAQLDLTSGDRLSVRQITWSGTAWKVRLVSGVDLEVPSDLFRSLDFGASKFTYLSDIEPRSVEYNPFYGKDELFIWDFRRDKDFDGNRISLGKKTYDKGLAIHSQARLKYRLGGDYRRFQAVMGIGDEIPQGYADVIIKADEKIIFSGVAKTNEAEDKNVIRRPPPQNLDFDVTGVVELEIFVGWGKEGGFERDIGDRVYFANARLVR